MNVRRVVNFSAGPGVLPEPVLELAAAEMLSWEGSGLSVMEMSHRGSEFTSIAREAEQDLRDLLLIPPHYKVLFLQGGASLQFTMIPMNLLGAAGVADYVVSGEWSNKAAHEARLFGAINIAASSAADGFRRMPRQDEWHLDPKAGYVHYCSNETIGGVETHWTPNTATVPLVADMSSHILSRPIEIERFGLIYAGAQKNIGPAGLTIVIIREDLIGRASGTLPAMLDFSAHARASEGMLNTPATYPLYIAGLVFKWIKAEGGVAAMESRAIARAKMLYAAIDGSGFYANPVAVADRSRMNIPFTLADSRFDESFLKGAEARDMVQLKGHRSVGGMRASLYNAMSIAGVGILVDYMREFAQRHG